MPKTVLIVDDIAFVRRTLSDILTQANYQVVAEAKDGSEALQLFLLHNPDVVTMDIVMPKMSGIEATRKIVKAEKKAKVVIVSAMGQENLVMEAINAGAKDYILKPFSAEEVIKTIDRVFNNDITSINKNAIRERTT